MLAASRLTLGRPMPATISRPWAIWSGDRSMPTNRASGRDWAIPRRFPPFEQPSSRTRQVDTSGEALRVLAGSSTPVDVLRMDSHEAEDLAGRPLPSREDSAGFAAGLVKDGAARSVIVARGADGSVIAGPDGAWHAAAAKVKVVSAVGAGDSFVAGFVLAMARDWPAPEALALGAAAASAAVMTPATDLCRAEDVDRFYAERVISKL